MSPACLSGDEFQRLFTDFEHTAFRLEVRDRYNVDAEDEPFRRFLAGEASDPSWGSGWRENIQRVTADGKLFERVRVKSIPLTDYSRFGLWACQLNIEAGEDIRYLTRDAAEGIELPNHDYWLFDSRTLVRMHFDEEDRPLQHEVITDPETIVQHNYWRDVAWHYAVRRDEFAKEHEPSLQRP
ncbi:DUF6879 family protein [Amycolatopsis cihanbeyliensis]|uniref:DUF6879 domain-containing protein n=1 Tax=Amycolatopsis cihanbeyliensis TaxID=1128664 RepID=A0A542CSU2_AMYCI|nr:DUF6879 family protein [Amycolatopsis cihanbeyliensis]TQI93893.1 hypothetical protein FB471_6039 [Amycolatopsis cihanbeyliensis]